MRPDRCFGTHPENDPVRETQCQIPRRRGHLTFTLGRDQQPVRHLQVPDRARRGRQCKRGRIQCHSRYVGIAEVPLLHRQLAVTEWRRPSLDRRSRIQHSPPCDNRRKRAPPSFTSSTKHSRGHPRSPRPHQLDVGRIQRLAGMCRSSS